jgi:succinyl-diaminopimelate desuccinylase
MSVGRDGASDAIAFMAAGIPAVEFGPDGAGHHGPEEWVSISSMARYRRSLVSFVRLLPIWLERPAPEATAGDGGGVAAEEPRSGLTAIEGGRR